MPLRESKRAARNQAVLRYKKQRQRNLLAKPGVHDFVLVLDHLKAGFNVPKIFRSAEAFGAREIHLINIGMFDPAPGKGSFRKVPAHFMEDFASSYQDLKARGYTLYTLEADQGASLSATPLAKKKRLHFRPRRAGDQLRPDRLCGYQLPLHSPVRSGGEPQRQHCRLHCHV